MRWQDFRRSGNLEDRRGQGGSRIPGGRTGLGIGTVLVLGLIGYALGIDPRILIGGAEILTGGGTTQQAPAPSPGRTGAPTDETGQFVAAVLGDTEDRWRVIFQAAGRQYQPAKWLCSTASPVLSAARRSPPWDHSTAHSMDVCFSTRHSLPSWNGASAAAAVRRANSPPLM